MKPAFLLTMAFFATGARLASGADPASPDISADRLLAHIKVLASDEFEGRGPGSKGEDLAVKYISEQFRALGLKPGNPDGTYVQEAPLAGVRGTPTASFTVAGQPPMELKFPSDYVATSTHLVPEVKVENSPVVFVGYGVVAPEYDWDDYKGVDLRGKTILMLINDPPIPDPKDPAKLDPATFRGEAMTYYGRWSYKYEIAAKMGAAAAVIVHETGPAAYPYSVVEMSWAKENFSINAADRNLGEVPVRSWVTLEVARKLCKDAGLDLDALKAAAARRDFRPVPLAATATFALRQAVRPFKSRNVVAQVPGTDPKLKEEWLIYSAHWDHLGRHPELQGDQIFNGAVDNASGVAALLELARAQQAAPAKRSALFIATTAEEAGLLGAKYYAQHPLYPLAKTLGDINIDGAGVWGRTRDLEDISGGSSTLSDLMAAAAGKRQRRLQPDAEPGKGYYYRADHFELSKVGIPALYVLPGTDVIGQPAGYGREKKSDYTAHHYHQPSDEVNPAWDLSGAAEDIALLFEVGQEVGNGTTWPTWKPGTEFEARRKAMLQLESH